MPVPTITGIGWGTDTYRAVFYPITTSGNIDASGTSAANVPYEGLEFAGPKNLSLNLGTPRAINNVSQGRVNDTIYLPSTDAKTAEFRLSYIDQVVFAALSAVKRQTIAGGKGFPIATNKQGLEIAGTFLISQLAFHDDSGLTQWHSYIMPRARAIVTMPGFTDAETDVTVNLSLSSTKKHIWGASLTENTDGATQMLAWDHLTWDIFNICAWRTDGSEDVFLLPTNHPSASSRADTLKVYDYSTGLEVSPAPSALSATEVTFTAAPTTGKTLICLYEASA